MRPVFVLPLCLLLFSQCKSSRVAADAGAAVPPPPVAAPPRSPAPPPAAKPPEKAEVPPVTPPPEPEGPRFDRGVAPPDYDWKSPVSSCGLYGDTVVGTTDDSEGDPRLLIWRREDVEGRWCDAAEAEAVVNVDASSHRLLGIAHGVAFVVADNLGEASHITAYQLPDATTLWTGACYDLSFEKTKLRCVRYLRSATASECDKFDAYKRDQVVPTLVEDVLVDRRTWRETRTGHLTCVGM